MKDKDLLGEQIEGYYLATELNFSSDSRSFLGERISPIATPERVFIKLLATPDHPPHQELESSEQKLAEIQQLNHPHILPVLSTGIVGIADMAYIITEYVATGSLYDHLQRKPPGQPLPEEKAFSFLAQIGQALQYAHEHQIIHGRLNPQNVLLKTSDQVVVTDFHLYTLLSSGKASATAPSDLSIYLAPEQLAGKTSEKSDQYALGCLAYEMLTGTKVFMIPSVNTPGKYYKTKSLILPRHLNMALPVHIEEAILKAMSRDPDQRYESIAAFLTAMDLSPVTEEKQPDSEVTALTLAGSTALMLVEAGDPIHPVTLAAATDPVLPVAPIPAMNEYDAETAETKNTATEVSASKLSNTAQRDLPFLPVWKELSSTRKRGLAVILCLLALTLGTGTLLEFLQPHPTPTVSRHTPTPTSISTTTVVRTSAPSGISLPPQSTPAVHHTKIPPNTSSTIPSPVPTQASTPKQAPAPTQTPTPSTSLAQVSLSPFFNDEGAGNWPGEANFDNAGYSYPADQLPSGSSITVNGIPYQFPTLASNTNDNISAFGQTIPLPSGHYHQIALLMSSVWGPVTGTLTIQYADGSSSPINLTVPDWIDASNEAPNVTNALQTSFRYSYSGISRHISYIYAVTVPVDSTRTANAVMLPSVLSGVRNTCQLHVFALTALP